MGKIIILDENTVNKIAAGEVVERPASVVKELVENSIDAGADIISVEIRNGGISFMKVTDNGSGMSEDDAAMAFESHATSKIRRADDLGAITSMGFRGEALASIAAVSKVHMLTRTHDSVQGVSITVSGGVPEEVRPAGCPAGTSITVSELFFNTPARYKFLKKDATEAGYIADILNRIALSHPEISFMLTNNGRKVLHTPGNGDLKSTIFSIYGAETAKHLADVDYEDGDIRITGFAGLAEIARSSRVNQSIYINRRYIRNKTVTSAIDAAYSTYLMKNKYPFIVLNISIDPSRIDVNVHPSKLEVKFSNEQDIFRAVYHAVNNALISHSTVRTLHGTEKSGSHGGKAGYGSRGSTVTGARSAGKSSAGMKTYTEINAYGKPSYSQQEFEWVRKELDRKYQEAISGKTRQQDTVGHGHSGKATDAGEKSEKIPSSQDIDYTDGHNSAVFVKDAHDSALGTDHTETDTNVISPDDSRKTDKIETCDMSDSLKLFDNTRIVGQLFSTYILLEGADELFLLDQHAAHERIRYEKLRRAYGEEKPLSQMLLSSVHVDLTGSEYQFAMSETDFFEKLGFTYESFGANSVIIRSAPLLDENTNIRECFTEILDFLMSEGSTDRSLLADRAIYRMACKSAVKAHDRLDEREIWALLDELSALENPYTCPHGRPAIYKIRRYDLEKLFKRIV